MAKKDDEEKKKSKNNKQKAKNGDTKAPKAVKISRNGKKFNASWTRRKSTYKYQYKVQSGKEEGKIKTKKVSISYGDQKYSYVIDDNKKGFRKDDEWHSGKLSASATSKKAFFELDYTKYYPFQDKKGKDKKKLHAIGFRVMAKGKKPTDKNATKFPTINWSKWAYDKDESIKNPKKQAQKDSAKLGFKLNVPKKPSISVTEGTYPSCTFKYSVNVSDSDKYIFSKIQYRTKLVENPTTSKVIESKPWGNWIFLNGSYQDPDTQHPNRRCKLDSASGSKTFIEDTSVIAGKKYARCCQFRALGPKGFGATSQYLYMVYSLPNTPKVETPIDSDKDVKVGKSYSSVYFKYSIKRSVATPIVEIMPQYYIGNPEDSSLNPPPTGWSDTVKTLPPSGDGDIAGAAQFYIQSTVSENQCLWVRVVSKNSDKQNAEAPSDPALAYKGKLSKPTKIAIDPIDPTTLRTTVSATNPASDSVPGSFIAVYHGDNCVGIISGDNTSTIIQLTSNPSSPEFKLKTILGKYKTSASFKETTDSSVSSTKLYYKKIYYSYEGVTPTGEENPNSLGWYECDGIEYTISSDTTVVSGKLYYEGNGDPDYVEADVEGTENPSQNNWFEVDGESIFSISNKKWESEEVKTGATIKYPQNVTLSRSDVSGSIRVSWDWPWKDADVAELSWSDNKEAWESTDEPSRYEINKSKPGSWIISGLENGVTWYVKVRLGISDSQSEVINYGPYADAKDSNGNPYIALTSSPSIPLITASKTILSIDDETTISWVYSSTDGVEQQSATLYEVVDDGSGVKIYNEIKTIDSGQQYINIRPSDEEWGWHVGDTHSLAIKVCSKAGLLSENYSNIIDVTVAEPATCKIVNCSITDGVLTEMPITFNSISKYISSEDTSVVIGKNYYSQTDVGEYEYSEVDTSEISDSVVNVPMGTSGVYSESISYPESRLYRVGGDLNFEDLREATTGTTLDFKSNYFEIVFNNPAYVLDNIECEDSELILDDSGGTSKYRFNASFSNPVTIGTSYLETVSFSASLINSTTTEEIGTIDLAYTMSYNAIDGFLKYYLDSYGSGFSIGEPDLFVATLYSNFDYKVITPWEGNPHDDNWYELDGTDYILSDDTTYDSQKTYYTRAGEPSYVYGLISNPSGNPKTNGYFEGESILSDSTITATIYRSQDFPQERPDESETDGFANETIYSGESSSDGDFIINIDDLIGRLDDRCLYDLVLKVKDSLGQTAEDHLPFSVSWTHQATYPEATVVVDEDETVAFLTPIAPKSSIRYVLTSDLEVDVNKSYYTFDEVLNPVDEQIATYLELLSDSSYAYTSDTTVDPNKDYYTLEDVETPDAEHLSTYYEYSTIDVCDIYRLSVDKPELIYEGATFGKTYVDPYPTIGEYGGHRFVCRTANNDYITSEGEIAWFDTDEDDGDRFDTHGNLIDFDGNQVFLLYEVDLSSAWAKDFQETKYLGGSVQGDWNPAVSRTGSMNVTAVSDQDQDMIQMMHRLAVYPGICHVRTKDGASYSADVQVNETYEYTNSPRFNKYSISITRVDPEGLDGMTYDDWKAAQPEASE